MSRQQIQEELNRIQQLLFKGLVSLAEERAYELQEAHPDDPNAIEAMCHVWLRLGDAISAAEIMEKLIERDPKNRKWLQMMAGACLRSGQREKALYYCDLLLQQAHQDDQYLFLLADIYERNNMPDECNKALDRVPQSTKAMDKLLYFRARLSMQRKNYDQSIKDLEEAVAFLDEQAVSAETDQLLQELWFLKAKSFDRMGEYDDAWASAETAHSIVPAQIDISKLLRISEKQKSFMEGAIFQSLAHASDSESTPLFIVGQPRSGTSLLEQILGMHPDVANGGEMTITGRIPPRMLSLTDSFLSWPQSLVDLRVEDANILARQYEDAESRYHDGTKKIITNKALNLPAYLGMFTLLLPRSRAIMLHRHPLDNCVSCFTTNLRSSGHDYTADIEALAQYWVARRQFQDIWGKVLEIPIMDLHYEILVDDQENETRRIIDFLDLPWNDSCLDFHKSEHVARTISYDQVNQKMYKTSSGRWKNYEKHLGPMINILGEYL